MASEICASGIGCRVGRCWDVDGSGRGISSWRGKVGGAGIRREVLQDKQVYVTACP